MKIFLDFCQRWTRKNFLKRKFRRDDIVRSSEQSERKSKKFDPCNPRPKRWTLAARSVDPSGGEANALSVPPGKYGRKAKTQRNRRGLTQAVDHVAQFDDKRGTLPGLEILLKVRRKANLPTRTTGQVLHG